jgi:hypothetical protein
VPLFPISTLRRVVVIDRRVARVFDGQARVRNITQPAAWLLLETVTQQRAHGGRSRGRQDGQVRLVFEHRREAVGRRPGGEGSPAGEQFVENAAEGPDVRTAVDRQSTRLLRTHVGWRAEHRAGLGATRRAIGVRSEIRQALRDAEVEDLDVAALRQRDVARFEIAVHDALLVRRGESVRDLPRDVEHLREREARVRIPRDQLCEGRPFHELHDQRRNAVGFFETIDLGDVGMVQRRQHPRFPFEAREPFRLVGEGCRQDLDRHVTVEPAIARPVDLPHAAHAEQADDVVGPDACGRIGGNRTGRHHLLDRFAARVGGQQRVEPGRQRGIDRGQHGDVPGAVGWLTLERGPESLFQFGPAFHGDIPVPVPGPRRSAASQACANRSSRFTVASEMLCASAISSSDRPPK